MKLFADMSRLDGRFFSWLLVGASAFVFIIANVHLVHVALSTQPDCVDHLKLEGHDGAYRAARSSC